MALEFFQVWAIIIFLHQIKVLSNQLKPKLIQMLVKVYFPILELISLIIPP